MKNLQEFNNASESDKQRAVEEFVNREIYCGMYTEINYILESAIENPNAPFCEDDITNNEPKGSCITRCKHIPTWEEFTEQERDDVLPHYEYMRDKWENWRDELIEKGLDDRADRAESKYYEFDEICQDLEDMDFDTYQEILEWYRVSGWLVRKLDEHGECTLNGCYWGRKCSGQSTASDSVIVEIYKELLSKS